MSDFVPPANDPPYAVAVMNRLSYDYGYDTPKARQLSQAATNTWAVISGLSKLRSQIELGVSHYTLLCEVNALLAKAHEVPST